MSLPLAEIIPPMKPLTVIKVDRPITQEDAQAIHDQFNGAVKDERPMIVIGPDTSVTVLEPWMQASRRAWLAVSVAAASMIIGLFALIFAYLWTH